MANKECWIRSRIPNSQLSFAAAEHSPVESTNCRNRVLKTHEIEYCRLFILLFCLADGANLHIMDILNSN